MTVREFKKEVRTRFFKSDLELLKSIEFYQTATLKELFYVISCVVLHVTVDRLF